MQGGSNSTCGNCHAKNTTCDGTQPVCNTCIRDGQFCSGLEPPQYTQRVSPASGTTNPSTEQVSPDALLRAVSTIIATPMWASRTPGFRPRYLSHPNPELNPFGALPRYSMIPKSIPPDPKIVHNALPFIYLQYTRWIKHMAFRNPPPFVMIKAMERFSISAITFALMTLGARIIQSMMDDTDRTDWKEYEKPINDLHWQACNAPEEGSSLVCTKGKLATAVELSAHKFILSGNASGYAFLRKTVPLAIRIAYNYPHIWTKQGKISTEKLLNLGAVELRFFFWMDTMTSTLFGTTPLLCYDTSVHERLLLRHSMEWMNGCPQEFISWFARLNTIRSTITRQGSGSLPIDLEIVEKEIQDWKLVMGGTDVSRDNVRRLAVVESWRHALLIYLHVGVCGVTSLDSRVQFSVKQIIQLSQLVKQEAMYKTHLFGPAVIAGVCARQESQRKAILGLVTLHRRIQVWVLQISDFACVLLHLWRGAARGGHPITWDDYIRSRRDLLPVNEPEWHIA